MLDAWKAFLESEGGKLAVVIAMIVIISACAMTMHMTHHDPAETGRTLITSALTSLLTLLLAKLK